MQDQPHVVSSNLSLQLASERVEAQTPNIRLSLMLSVTGRVLVSQTEVTAPGMNLQGVIAWCRGRMRNSTSSLQTRHLIVTRLGASWCVSQPRGRALRLTETLLGLLLLAIFLSVRDLPLVDLPQHALQLASWLRLDAHAAGVSQFELNFRTPYLLGYPLARALAVFLPILTALKLTFWASITLQAVALRKLCAGLGHDAWLGLLGFPLGLGYSFCFGFVAFCSALPLVYLVFLQAFRHRAAPSFKGGLGFAATLALLLVAHGVALGFLLVVLGPLLLWGGGKLWQRVLPLLAPPLLGALWLLPGGRSTRLGGDYWAFEPERLLEIPGQLVGIGSADRVATVLGACLLLAVALSLGARRSWLLLFPLVAAFLGYALFPSMFRGAGPLGPRFSSYFVPAALVAFAPRSRETPARQLARRALIFVVSATVVLVFAWRLPAFNRETADFHALAARLPTGLELRPLVFERGGRAFPGTPAHLHMPAYYSLEKGGSAGYSFAMYSISVVRFRKGVRIKMAGGAEWAPERFDAAQEAADYDYFIVKSSFDRTASLFPGPAPAAVLDQHIGDWWGYRRVAPATL